MDGVNYITYLSPGIPEKFFRFIVAEVSEAAGISGSLSVESGVSGPPKGSDDPFTSGNVDAGFMCAPPYLWLRERESSPVELLGVAPVPGDARCGRRAVYFSDVVVRSGSEVRSFGDLRGRLWAYNDACSLSGYYGMKERLLATGEEESFFAGMVCSGSHSRSIEMLLAGEVDVTAVDSNALAMRLRTEPRLRSELRVVEGLGPFPIQPVVVRRSLDGATKSLLREAFLGLDLLSPTFSSFGFERYTPVTDDHYAAEELFLRKSGVLG